MDWITATGELSSLRSEFPGWGIFHAPDLRRWYAVGSVGEPIVAGTPGDLRARLGDTRFTLGEV